MDDIGRHLFEMANDLNAAAVEHIAIGREQGRREGQATLRAIVAAYDKALAIEGVNIPTPLHMAIEAARLKL